MLNSSCGKPVMPAQNMRDSGLNCPYRCALCQAHVRGIWTAPHLTADLGLWVPAAIGLLLLCSLSPFCSSTETCRALGLRASIWAGRRPIYWEVTSVGGNHMKPFHFNVNESQQATLNVARCRWISYLLKVAHSPSPCSIMFSVYMIKVEKMLFFVFLVTWYCTFVFSESFSRKSHISMWLLCDSPVAKQENEECTFEKGRLNLFL